MTLLEDMRRVGCGAVVKVGDTVMWRGGFGLDAPQSVTVVSMEITDQPRSMCGTTAEEASWALVWANRVLFALSSGNWAYSEQIERVA